MFRKDDTTQTTTCSICNRGMKPFPALQKMIEAYVEAKNDEKSLFHPNPILFTKKAAPSKDQEKILITKASPKPEDWT